jgi:hypothetical protein
VSLSNANELSYGCLCRGDYTGRFCEKERVVASLPDSCFDIDWDAPTDSFQLRSSRTASRTVMCQMDVMGGGYTFCGKVLHDLGARNGLLLAQGFGRSDLGASDAELRDARSFSTGSAQAWLVGADLEGDIKRKCDRA